MSGVPLTIHIRTATKLAITFILLFLSTHKINPSGRLPTRVSINSSKLIINPSLSELKTFRSIDGSEVRKNII